MRYSVRLFVSGLLLCFGVGVWAQGPTYDRGRAPTPEEIQAWDIDVDRDGNGLPPGSGTAVEGSKIYTQKCAFCHGPTGEGGVAKRLFGGQGSIGTDKPIKTIGSYWPYAPTLFDFINRAMPENRPGTLTADEVYALTAFLLYRNEIIGEKDVIDATSLPKIRMPNRNGFLPEVPEWREGMKRRLGYYPSEQ
jgi:cytochrome c